MNNPLDLDDISKKMMEAIDKITPEDIEKYFPSCKIPKGWVSIDDHLPMMLAEDVLKGCTEYKIKFADGTEAMTCVSDHTMWYYDAKEKGVTHWYNE